MKARKTGSAVWRLTRVLARGVGLVAILLVLLVVSAGVFLRVMLTPEQLSSLIASQLQELLHRPVQIGEVNVLLLQGIRIRGLRVLEAPGFPGGEFLSSEIAVAKYRWASLLRRRLEFSEVRLVTPRIQLVRRQDGEWNVQGLFHPGASSGTPKGLPLPVSLAADVVGIEDAHVTVRDLVRQRLVEVRGFDLQVRDFSPARPFPINASFATDANLGGKKVQLSTEFSGTLSLSSFTWTEATMDADKLRVSVEGDTINASGRVRNFKAPVIDFKLKVPRLTSEILGRYWAVPAGISIPPTLVRVRGKLPDPGTFVLDSLDVAAEPLRLHASGSLKLGDDPTYRFSASVPQAPLERLAALWAGWAPRKFSGTGQFGVTAAGKLGPGERAVVEKLDLTLKDFAMVLSTNSAITNADITVAASKNFDEIEVKAPKGRLVAFGNAFSDVDLIVRLTGGDVDIEKLHMTWSISRLKLKGRIRNLAAPKGVDLEGTVDKLQLQEAINATTAVVQQIRAAGTPAAPPAEERKWSQVFKYAIPKSFPATNGNLRISELTHPNFNTFNVEVKWGLHGISTGLEQVSGFVRTGFGPGRVTDIPELEKAHKLLRAIFLPFVYMHKMNNMAVISAATAYPKTLDFTRIYGQYRLQEGVVDICAFHVDSPQLVAFADGKVDFPKERVGLHVLTRLTSSRAPLPQYMSDERGRPSLGFYVKDDLNKPSFEIDFRKMSAAAIEDSLQAGLKCGQ